MTDDLYQMLGVPRDARRAAIHAAYRRLSKAAHPDVGGSEVAFARLKLARDVLVDPARRARYDATGGYDAGTPDNDRAHALGLISRVMDSVMGRVVKSGQEPVQTDFAAAVRAELNAISIQVTDRLRDVAAYEVRWTSMLPRCVVAPSSQEANLLAPLIAAKLESLAQMRLQCDAELRITAAALGLMASQEFRHDAPPPSMFWRVA